MAIRKNKNGTWTVDIYDLSGKKILKRFNRKSDAAEFEFKNKKQKMDRKHISLNLRKQRITIQQATKEYLNTKSRLRAKSIQKYTSVIEQFRQFCASQDIYYIDEVTPDVATKFYDNLVSTDAKPKTINFYLSSVKAMFRLELQKDGILKNPFDHIKNLSLGRRIPEYYSAEELKEFFSQEMHICYRNVFKALLNTGMRFGEAANLVWSNVDLENKLLYIRSNNDFNTKTINSERVIPLNSTMFNLLKSISENKQSEAYVFCSPTGNKINERTLLSVCKRVAEAAGITGRAYLHKFRHTFASHLIQQGVPLEQIQKLLGHASIVDTLIYAHLKPQNLHPQVAVLDKLFQE